MNYQKISYKEKIRTLHEVPEYRTSAALCHALGISRGSLLNWKEDDSRISETNRVKIDTLYCKAVLLPTMGDDMPDHPPVALPGDFFDEPQLRQRIVHRMSFGSLEIETGTNEEDYKSVIEDDTIPHDLHKQEVLEINGITATTNRMVAEVGAEGALYIIDSRRIKDWHASVMQGIRTDAGQYSKKIRILPDTDIQTTTPEDIEAEVEYWVTRYKNTKTLEEISIAHAHFESIHPFGDGNGRVGRLIMAAQCLRAGLMPPEINKRHKALYYAVLEHAQITGKAGPLVQFLNGRCNATLTEYRPTIIPHADY